MTARECAICYPLVVPCLYCDEKEAMHQVITGHRRDPFGGEVTDVITPMCHGCAVEQRHEKDAGHAD